MVGFGEGHLNPRVRSVRGFDLKSFGQGGLFLPSETLIGCCGVLFCNLGLQLGEVAEYCQ